MSAVETARTTRPNQTSSRPSRPAIELVGVRKRFLTKEADYYAVEELHLAVQPGQFFSLLGPSGCGKSTTLRMVAGFDHPTQGRILLDGQDVVGVPPNKRDVNMVFQNYALFPNMSVFDNVAFGLRQRKVPPSQLRERVERMLDLVELRGREKHRPHQLSGGQQQRVALARALVNEPRALLLDEPLGALDFRLRQTMQMELKRIQREVGITFVYVTHDQGEALAMSDRVAVMNHGRLEQVGTPQQIFDQPASAFVAGFMGTTNLLDLVVVGTERRTVVATVGGAGRVVVPTDAAPVPGAILQITIRPERMQLHLPEDSSAAPDTCAVDGTISEVAYLGTATTYRIRTSNGVELAVTRTNDATTGRFTRGTRVCVSWRPEHGYLIPPGPRGVSPGTSLTERSMS